MKRKILSLLLATSMLAACLTGCGNETKEYSETQAVSNSTEESKQSEVASQPAEEELEYVELNWLCRADGGNNDVDLIQEALDEYFLEKLNCKVNFLHTKNYSEVVDTQLLAGDDLDLVYVYARDYSGLAKQGVFEPLDEYWEYGPNVKAMVSEDIWGCMTVDGHAYAVPTLRDNAYIMSAVYNNTLATKLGLDIEKDSQNWSSMKDVADYAIKAIKIRDEKFPEYKGKPLMSKYTGPVPYYYAFEQLSGNLAGCNVSGLEVDATKGKDTVFSFYETEAYKEYALTQLELANSGVIDFELTSPDRNEYTLFQPGWGYTWISEDLYGLGYETKLAVFEDSLWTDGASYTVTATAIASASKNPERAMMVLDALCSDPYLATLLRFGVEGIHWERDAEGKMQLAGRNLDAQNRGWLSWFGNHHPNLHIAEAPESYSGPDNIMLKKMNEYVSDATVASHMGFVFNTDAVANEIAACNNVIAEYNGLDIGAYGTEEATLKAVDEFVAKLKANGLDKIIAEVQAQVDAWVAAR